MASCGQYVRGESGSRGLDNRGELVFWARGYANLNAAIAAVLAAAPTTYEGETIQNVTWTDYAFGNGDIGYDITLSYQSVRSRLPAPVGFQRWRTTIATEGKKITQSKETRNQYTNRTPIEYGGQINVTDDGPEGVEILTPTYEMVCDFVRPASDIDLFYQTQLFRMTATYNNAAFRGFDAGEVLFLGAELVQRGNRVSDPWDCTYRFRVNPNIVDATIGAGLSEPITGVDALGHDTVWVKYQREVNETEKTAKTVPTHVFVERVYEPSDFADLEL